MKNWIITLWILVGATYVQAQNISKAVPPEVQDALSMLYPEAGDIEWNLKGVDFEASFKQGKRNHLLLFDKNGMLKEVRKEIAESELPPDANALLNQKYARGRILKAFHASIIGTPKYEVLFVIDQDTLSLIFDASGALKK